MAQGRAQIRCAVYTRKSTEEGLEQAFNSLDAQREACSAYVLSQIHEGWMLLPALYDDGGFSGGTMERPGLKALLADVKAGRVDVIIVYKVDRLTRSLADFAKIVEVLDAHGASFVSVTQAFNTTSSMGRLTLNVLLSFAQFEREVTGERIRDKVAASKKKGIWMGGNVPLGYEVKERRLLVVPEDAQTVEMIYNRYLALGSVRALAQELEARGIRSKVRTSRTGRTFGDASFSRGALYLMLQNRIYLGEIMHQGEAYAGEHPPIIEPELFGKVAAMIRQNRTNYVDRVHARDPSLLVGKVWDAKGRRMSPRHTSRQDRHYRYYRSRIDGLAAKDRPWSVPSGDLEGLVMAQLMQRLDMQTAAPSSPPCSTDTPPGAVQRQLVRDHVERVEVHRDKVIICIKTDEQTHVASIPVALVRGGKEKRLVVAPADGGPARRDPSLIKLVVNAHIARDALERAGEQSIPEIATSLGYSRDYYRVLLRTSYLAPDIVAAIIDGRQPAHLTRQKLARMSALPIDWQGQREALGFS